MDDMHMPLDTARLKRVGGQKGSNPAGVYEDERGQRYYVKTLESSDVARNEWLAAQLYRLAGAPTLDYVPAVRSDQIVTRWVSLDKNRVAQLDAAERLQAQHWLGVHAWMANWDAAGFDGDNQGVFNGIVLTLDLGGALAFRAQGDPKGKAFGERVDELDSMRHDPANPHACALFGGMSDEAMREAVAVVAKLSDESIKQVLLHHGGSGMLVDKMLARKRDMLARWQLNNQKSGMDRS